MAEIIYSSSKSSIKTYYRAFDYTEQHSDGEWIISLRLEITLGDGTEIGSSKPRYAFLIKNCSYAENLKRVTLGQQVGSYHTLRSGSENSSFWSKKGESRTENFNCTFKMTDAEYGSGLGSFYVAIGEYTNWPSSTSVSAFWNGTYTGTQSTGYKFQFNGTDITPSQPILDFSQLDPPAIWVEPIFNNYNYTDNNIIKWTPIQGATGYQITYRDYDSKYKNTSGGPQPYKFLNEGSYIVGPAQYVGIIEPEEHRLRTKHPIKEEAYGIVRRYTIHAGNGPTTTPESIEEVGETVETFFASTKINTPPVVTIVEGANQTVPFTDGNLATIIVRVEDRYDAGSYGVRDTVRYWINNSDSDFTVQAKNEGSYYEATIKIYSQDLNVGSNIIKIEGQDRLGGAVTAAVGETAYAYATIIKKERPEIASFTTSPSPTLSAKNNGDLGSNIIYAHKVSLQASLKEPRNGKFYWYIKYKGETKEVGIPQGDNFSLVQRGSADIDVRQAFQDKFGITNLFNIEPYEFLVDFQEYGGSNAGQKEDQTNRKYGLSNTPYTISSAYSPPQMSNCFSNNILPGTGYVGSGKDRKIVFSNQLRFFFTGDNGVRCVKINVVGENSGENYFLGGNNIFSVDMTTGYSGNGLQPGNSTTNGYVDVAFVFPTTVRGTIQFSIDCYRDISEDGKEGKYYMGTITGYTAQRVSAPDIEDISFVNLAESTPGQYKIKPYTYPKVTTEDGYEEDAGDIVLAFNNFLAQVDFPINSSAAASDLKNYYALDSTADFFKVNFYYNGKSYSLNDSIGGDKPLTFQLDYFNGESRETIQLKIDKHYFSRNFYGMATSLDIVDYLNMAYQVQIETIITNAFGDKFRVISGEDLSKYLILDYVESIKDVSFTVNYMSDDFTDYSNQVMLRSNGPNYIYEGDSLFFKVTWDDYNPEPVEVRIETARSLVQLVGDVPTDQEESDKLVDLLAAQQWEELLAFSGDSIEYNKGNRGDILTEDNNQILLPREERIYEYKYDKEILRSFYVYYRVTVIDSVGPVTEYYTLKTDDGVVDESGNGYGILVRHAAGTVTILDANYERDPSSEGGGILSLVYDCDNLGANALQPGNDELLLTTDIVDTIKIELQYTTDIENIDKPMTFYTRNYMITEIGEVVPTDGHEEFHTADMGALQVARIYYERLATSQKDPVTAQYLTTLTKEEVLEQYEYYEDEIFYYKDWSTGEEMYLELTEDQLEDGLDDFPDDTEFYSGPEVYVEKGLTQLIYWHKPQRTTEVDQFKASIFGVNEDGVFVLVGEPPKTDPEWSFYHVRFKITTTRGDITKVFASNSWLVFNSTPTVSYRRNCVGINTYDVDKYRGKNPITAEGNDTETGDAILVVGETTGRRMIYFVGTLRGESQPSAINITTGEMAGFIIDGGSWD